MRVPECQFIFFRILKMRNENFSSFSFFISVENWKQFHNHFSIFLYNKNGGFFNFSFKFSKKKNENENLTNSFKKKIRWKFRFKVRYSILEKKLKFSQDPGQPCLQQKQASRDRHVIHLQVVDLTTTLK